MSRMARPEFANSIVHVLNRAARRVELFSSEDEYAAFCRDVVQARARFDLRILAHCLMPNHWHVVAWPTSNRQLSEFIKVVCVRHALRWHGRRGTHGTGAVYQSRFRAFLVQPDAVHIGRVIRYVERNALRAGLVGRAESWPWGSLAGRLAGDPEGFLTPAPVPLPADWAEFVNAPQSEAELARLRASVQGARPFGSAAWSESLTVTTSPPRPRGRPKK